MNKTLKVAIIIIAITLIAVLAVSMAYSRYFSKISGTGTATVAKWSFKANGKTDNLGTITLGNTTADNSKVADGKIAPGTAGKFSVALDATETEVALDYTISFDNVNGTFPDNLKFYETKNAEGDYANEITDITTQGMKGTIGIADTKTKTVEIYWVWEYQTGSDETAITDNDGKDTTSGVAAQSLSFDVIVTGTQSENK